METSTTRRPTPEEQALLADRCAAAHEHWATTCEPHRVPYHGRLGRYHRAQARRLRGETAE